MFILLDNAMIIQTGLLLDICMDAFKLSSVDVDQPFYSLTKKCFSEMYVNQKCQFLLIRSINFLVKLLKCENATSDRILKTL